MLPLALLLLAACGGKVLSVEDFGAIADNTTAALSNAEAFNKTLASLQEGESLLVPAGKVFHVGGGLIRTGLQDNVIRIEGDIVLPSEQENWPVDGTSYRDWISLQGDGITVTGGGLIDGSGAAWWIRELLGKNTHSRPRIMIIESSSNVLVDNIRMKNSPRFHLYITLSRDVEVRGVDIDVDLFTQRAIKKKYALGEIVLQPWDLNTDGIDVGGSNIWVHDCNVRNDDDSVAVKIGANRLTENVLIENMNLTGFGASIGSVPPKIPMNVVRNVTFRNISMPETGKGIYIKSNPSCDPGNTALIEDILYEDIRISNPKWWSIWIGPQQQHEPNEALGEKCSLDWPLPGSQCPTQGCVTFQDITLRRVTITNPLLSPGVILGNSTNPMKTITFEDVVVKTSNGAHLPWGNAYKCKHANVQVVGSTNPLPNCG